MSSEFSTNAAVNIANNNSAYSAALERARQIAAKINPSGAQDNIKRKIDDSNGFEPENKRAYVGNFANNGLLNSDQVSALAASSIVSGFDMPGVSSGPTSVKEIRVPDKMVGLIIGRGGEQISRLQSESGCKIQMASDTCSPTERLCTLTGNAHAVSKAEELITSIIQTRIREIPGSAPYTPSPSVPKTAAGLTIKGGNGQYEIMVPGSKVGLIIGKGGEMIKQLQERSGAKLVVIQDNPTQENEKPLRISGDPAKVEVAKQMVLDMIADKDLQNQQYQNRRGQGSGGGRSGGLDGGKSGGGNRSWDSEQLETSLTVPAEKCGLIIGKGGETIRQINQQTGAFCEIDRKQSSNPAEKVFVIRGTPQQIDQVKQIFSEKLNISFASSQNGQMNGNSGYGGPNNGPNGMPAMQPPNSGGYSGGPWAGAGGAPTPQFQAWGNAPGPGPMPQGPTVGVPVGGGPPANNPVQVNPAPGQADYSQQWLEYYRTMGMEREAALLEQQIKAQQQALLQAQAQAQQANASGEPPDYSEQWAAYYRSTGQIKEAEAIENSMKAKQAAAGASQQVSAATPATGFNPQQGGAPYAVSGYPAGPGNAYYGAPQMAAPTGGQYNYANYGPPSAGGYPGPQKQH